MTHQISDLVWQSTSWDGNLRAQLRRTLQFTLRERLQAVEDMAEVARRFEQMRSGRPIANREHATELAVAEIPGGEAQQA